MKLFRDTVFLLLILLNVPLFAQSDFGVGKWRLHSVFGSIENIVKANERIYAQSSSSLYYYNTNENSLVELSKVDGLSSNQFSSIGFDKSTNTLIIGYLNGGIDLIKGNSIITINNIQKSNITGSKRINHIQASKGKGYLSTEFGLVVLNLNKNEIAETYRSIGTQGAIVSVTYSEISSTDSLYILTNEGVKVANTNGQYNLLDGSNWENINFTNGQIEKFHLFKNQLVALIDKRKVYKKTSTGEERINVPEQLIRTLSSNDNTLFVSYSSFIYQYNGTITKQLSNHQDIQATNDILAENNVLWTGNNDGSITRLTLSPITTTKYKIAGLTSDKLWKGAYINDKLFITGGGYNDYASLERQTIIHSFDNGWITKKKNLQSTDGVYNAMDIVYNDAQGKYYIACYRGGIIEWDGNNNFTNVPDDLAPFTSALTDQPWVKVFDLEMHNGEMWATNNQTNGEKSIHKMDRNGVWSSYKLQSTNADFPEDIQVDNNGLVWVMIGWLGKSGMIYYNPETGQERYLSNSLNNGGLPHAKVNDFAIDKENNVWVGTNQGAASFQNTSEIFNNNSYNAVKPIVGGRPLLQDEQINAVAIDGGNRKWFGTDNGVFLFDDNGEKALKTFNVNNSPLPSNIIKDITINDKTGEIFFITSKGLASYWGEATESTDKHENVEVFPNPVPPNYDGMIAIRGLATDALVKITDVAGRLVYETNAEGGQAVWNGMDINGNKVRTGVYLIFSSSTTGEDRFAGKFAVVE